MAFKVFNPMTGQHIHCETVDEAKDTLVLLVKQCYMGLRPNVMRRFINDKGDFCWVDSDIDEGVTFSKAQNG